MYFLQGSLPWQEQDSKHESDADKRQHLVDSKIMGLSKALRKDYPEEFSAYFRYCRDLGFEDEPDYAHLRQAFKDLAIREGCGNDVLFDGMVIPSHEDNTARTPPDEAVGAVWTEFSCSKTPTDIGAGSAFTEAPSSRADTVNTLTTTAAIC